MAEQSGRSVAALQARLTELANRHGAIAEADRRLAEAVSTAHGAAVRALAALDRIETEIESVVAARDALALDVPSGARELQRFLIDKQREIITVVQHARECAASKAVSLQEISSTYSTTDGPSTG
jgi:hypothetical protein